MTQKKNMPILQAQNYVGVDGTSIKGAENFDVWYFFSSHEWDLNTLREYGQKKTEVILRYLEKNYTVRIDKAYLSQERGIVVKAYILSYRSCKNDGFIFH